MRRLLASIKKEYLLLINDKIGLLLMFLLPLFLVFIITIVQNSAYKIVNENKISLLLVNNDNENESKDFIKLIEQTNMFDISYDNTLKANEVEKYQLKNKILTALYIPDNFSQAILNKSTKTSDMMMLELGLLDSLEDNEFDLPVLKLFHDPVLQENYVSSIENIMFSMLRVLENTILIEKIFIDLGIEEKSEEIKNSIINDKIEINRIVASTSKKQVNPNATQHNVPAWTIFAMFFMVVSLGSNIVKEKNSGSFQRLKTLPNNFPIILGSKLLLYMFVAIIQVALIFSIGKFIFPLINLPELIMPSNIIGFVLVVLLSSLTAVSYAVLVGTFAKTQEQANGFGSVSIIIFAALGGIWVPTFIMPEYLQIISKFSPMNWCLNGFYTLFLKGGNWSELFYIFAGLLGFIIISLLATFLKLRKDKLI